MASLLNIRQDIEMLERAPVDRWRGEYVLDLLSSMADRIDQLERSRAEEIAYLRGTVVELAKLSQHADNCSWITPLPTGEGYWGCDCGLDRLVLDGEPTDEALTPNAKCTAPVLHNPAHTSSDSFPDQ